MEIQQGIARIVEGIDLTRDEMESVMHQVMGGEATPAQIAGLLVALRMKGECLAEVVGAATVMRELATPVDVDQTYLVDIVGTGGDGANLFNVSTAASFVIAASGARVAKHGNRAVSSTSGSSDLLAHLGIALDLSPGQVARCINEIGMGFMFAPAHHSAMKHAIGPRRDLGLRTIFNILGPLTNPAGVKRSLIGVYSPSLCLPMAEVLKQLGSEHVMVVHSHDGLDEISIAAPTSVAELRDGAITEYTLEPPDLGVESGSLNGLSVSSVEESLALIKGALRGDDADTSRRAAALVQINAGAAIYVSGVATSMQAGVQMAEDAIASGAAWQKVEEFAQFTRLCAESGS